MGKKTNWFVSVKKAFSPESKEKANQKTSKSKRKWGFGKAKPVDPSSSEVKTLAPPVPVEEVKLTDERNEHNSHSYSVAMASAAAAEAAVAAAQAAAEVVRLTTISRYSGKSKEEVAAIKIQTAFRGYLARRALRALRGLVRLKNLVQGNSVKRQATTTLRCMQTLAKVQSQIRSRRIRMSEENQALQRQLQLKREKELENLKASIGHDWDDSMQSREDIETSLQQKHEAGIRRERALAYAYTHQQQVKNASRSVHPMFTDPSNPQWGWSWLERWMASRPWETRTLTDKDDSHSSVKSVPRSMAGEVTKSYTRRDLNNDKVSPGTQKQVRPQGRQSPTTPSKPSSSITAKARRMSLQSRGSMGLVDDDLRSVGSLQSDKFRRHSIAASSVRDDESLASSPSVPSYMAATESARAKSRLASPLGNKVEGTPDRVSVGSVKKRLSFPPSPGGLRRHSGPPKVDLSSLKDFDEHDEQITSNGGSIQA